MHEAYTPADMAYTFKSDDHMVITIPFSSVSMGKEERLLPENFNCVFKDAYKVFLKGNPKALGTAQFITGILIIIMGILTLHGSLLTLVYSLPSVLFIVSGCLSYAAGHSPNMYVTKLSFSLNILSLFLATAALVALIAQVALVHLVPLVPLVPLVHATVSQAENGMQGMVAVFLAMEMVVAVILIYWESKAVCRNHFNILPVVKLMHEA